MALLLCSWPSDEKVKDEESPSDSGCSAVAGDLNWRDRDDRAVIKLMFRIDFRVLFISKLAIGIRFQLSFPSLVQ